MTNKVNTTSLPVVAAVALLAIGGGCSSDRHSDPSGDASANNRLMLRMALGDNVYNGIAAERAVYPKDFLPASASLNELGTRRVETLIDACRGGSGNIAVIRGDESDAVYEARVGTVRQQFADAGADLQRMIVAAADHVNGDGVGSDRALLSYNRMLSDYAPKKQQGGNGNSQSFEPTPMGTTDSNK